PGLGGAIDINVLNDRNWIDVVYTQPSGGSVTINRASIEDLAPEFGLSGPGLGAVQLDGTRAPVLIASDSTTLTYRYWVTGKYAASGSVTLIYLPNSWSYDLSSQPAATAVVVGGFV